MNLNFDRHRYLLHLVPVGRRYLEARKLGLYSSKPVFNKRPNFETFYPLEYKELPNSKKNAYLGKSVVNWFEHLYQNDIHELLLTRESKLPFISLNGCTSDFNHWYSFMEVHPHTLYPFSSTRTSSKVETIVDRQSKLQISALQLSETLTECIEFSKKYPTRLRDWQMALKDAKEILHERNAPFSDYLYLSEHGIPRSTWVNLIPCDDRILSQTLFQICIDYPLLMKHTSENEDYIDQLGDIYLDLVKSVGNTL